MSHYEGSVPAAPRKPDWRDDALCRQEDPELFFPKGNDGPWLPAIEQAKTICRSCPSVSACLAFALDENIGDGIYGGLTATQRRSLRRAAARGRDTTATAEAARRPKPPEPRTLAEYFNLNTRAAEGQHRLWVGVRDPHFGGRRYTPKQLAFTVDRGHYPNGRVFVSCELTECVLPAHLRDQKEREVCGTTTGYRAHRTRGEQACGPCREANMAAIGRPRSSALGLAS